MSLATLGFSAIHTIINGCEVTKKTSVTQIFAYQNNDNTALFVVVPQEMDVVADALW
jgi:hypothetical protein